MYVTDLLYPELEVLSLFTLSKKERQNTEQRPYLWEISHDILLQSWIIIKMIKAI